jgi:hypothetical protein
MTAQVVAVVRLHEMAQADAADTASGPPAATLWRGPGDPFAEDLRPSRDVGFAESGFRPATDRPERGALFTTPTDCSRCSGCSGVRNDRCSGDAE